MFLAFGAWPLSSNSYSKLRYQQYRNLEVKIIKMVNEQNVNYRAIPLGFTFRIYPLIPL